MPLPSRRFGQLALIAALTALVAVLALCFDRNHNGDVYLGIASGRALEQDGILQRDPFPTIAQGDRWLNVQWLPTSPSSGSSTPSGSWA